MQIDVNDNSKLLVKVPENYTVNYKLEQDDIPHKDTILVLLSGLLTSRILHNGDFQSSIIDFFIFRNKIKNSKFEIQLNLTDGCLEVCKEYLTLMHRIEDIKAGAFNSEIITTIKSQPYEDQKAHIRFFLENKIALNCSSVGIGKTLSALATYNILKDSSKVLGGLILCLNQNKRDWCREIQKHTDYTFKVVGNGTNQVVDDIFSHNCEDFLIVHYDCIIKEVVKAALIEKKFDFWISDEAHVLRGLDSQRSKAVFEMFNAVTPQFLYFLTGTPVSNSPMNAFSMLKFFNSSLIPNKTRFESHFCNMITIKPKGSFKRFKILNKKNPYKHLDELSFMMNRFSVRTTHADVKDFPPTVYSFREVEMEPEQRKLYNAIRDETFQAIAAMPEKSINLHLAMVKTIRLRQALSNPSVLGEYKVDSIKFKCVNELLEEILDDDPTQKVVLFSCLRPTLELLTQKYRDKYGAVLFAGIGDGLTIEGRDEGMESFLTNPDTRVLVANTQLGVGGNWGHVARTGIIVDLPIVPIDFEQSVGRITRRGAQGTSNIIIIKGVATVDDVLWNWIHSKKDIANKIIKGEEMVISKDDFLKMLKKAG